jgi:hypothetical protein
VSQLGSLNVAFPSGPSSAGGGNSIFTPDNIQSPYTYYEIVTSFVFDNGVALLPVAKQNADGSPIPASIVQLSSAFGFRYVSWRCQRRADFPLCPDWATSDPNQVFKRSLVRGYSPRFTQDQQSPIITVEGRYEYELRLPLSIQNGKFYLGGAPMYVLNAAGNVLTAANFSKVILGPGNSGS